MKQSTKSLALSKVQAYRLWLDAPQVGFEPEIKGFGISGVWKSNVINVRKFGSPHWTRFELLPRKSPSARTESNAFVQAGIQSKVAIASRLGRHLGHVSNRRHQVPSCRGHTRWTVIGKQCAVFGVLQSIRLTSLQARFGPTCPTCHRYLKDKCEWASMC